MSRRKRASRQRKGCSSPEAAPCPPATDQELRILLASAALLDRVRDVARRIDERVRQVMGLQGPHGPGPAAPERGQPDRAAARPGGGELE
jgi:hypothetical protein